jgi:hypothetical protein
LSHVGGNSGQQPPRRASSPEGASGKPTSSSRCEDSGRNAGKTCCRDAAGLAVVRTGFAPSGQTVSIVLDGAGGSTEVVGQHEVAAAAPCAEGQGFAYIAARGALGSHGNQTLKVAGHGTALPGSSIEYPEVSRCAAGQAQQASIAGQTIVGAGLAYIRLEVLDISGRTCCAAVPARIQEGPAGAGGALRG